MEQTLCDGHHWVCAAPCVFCCRPVAPPRGRQYHRCHSLRVTPHDARWRHRAWVTIGWPWATSRWVPRFCVARNQVYPATQLSARPVPVEIKTLLIVNTAGKSGEMRVRDGSPPAPANAAVVDAARGGLAVAARSAGHHALDRDAAGNITRGTARRSRSVRPACSALSATPATAPCRSPRLPQHSIGRRGGGRVPLLCFSFAIQLGHSS